MTSYRYEIRQVDESKVEQQIQECLPLIELERSAFIHAEYGRLQAVMGTEYEDPKTGKQTLFHAIDETNNDISLEGEKVGDPFEITLAELDQMPALTKRIERLGTVSYMPFFRMMPEDRKRLHLLHTMQDKIYHHYPCLDSEVKELKEGHEAYLAYKNDDGPAVIA